MITRVKIAPTERWCDFFLRRQPTALVPGELLAINVHSSAVDPIYLDLDGHPPGFRWWEIPKDEQIRLRGYSNDRCCVCEHVLEMD